LILRKLNFDTAERSTKASITKLNQLVFLNS